VTTPVPRVKEPHLAGRAYPAAREALAEAVRELLTGAGEARPGVVAVIAPHGSFAQSGAVAARAFAAAGSRWRRALVLAPSHFAEMHGATVLPMDAYRTPLGPVAIDAAGVAALTRPPLVRANPAVFQREPGIEAQLPFLQTLAPDCRIVPLLVGALDDAEAVALAALVAPLLDEGTLAVVSSDLLHYGRRFGWLPVPPTDVASVAAALGRLDDAGLAYVVACDADGFARWIAETGATVCGRRAIEVLLRALPASARGERLAYATSLQTTGDPEHVVTHAAVAFTR
jgi:AmmeMemoRadiSam system protein B